MSYSMDRYTISPSKIAKFGVNIAKKHNAILTFADLLRGNAVLFTPIYVSKYSPL